MRDEKYEKPKRSLGTLAQVNVVGKGELQGGIVFVAIGRRVVDPLVKEGHFEAGFWTKAVA